MPPVKNTSIDAAHSQLKRRIDERIQLRVIKSAVSANCDTVQEKENAISEERNQLGNLFNEVWAAEDSYCNRIWSFATQHDFHAIFSRYPEITAPIKHACPYDSNVPVENNYSDAAVDRDIAVLALKRSIGDIEKDIFNVSPDTSIRQEIERSLKKLEELRSISEDMLEVLKSIDERAKIEGKNRKRQNATDVSRSTFVSAKKLAKSSNDKSRFSTRNNNASALTKFKASEPSSSETMKIGCFGRFTVKKRSDIALKFEKKRTGAT